MANDRDDETRKERRERGLAAFKQVNSRAPTLDTLEAVSPEFTRWIFEFVYGDVFSRPNLDLKSRELVIIASLVTLGANSVPMQLEVHILGALRVGATKEEIIETILQLSVYAGFPAAHNALLIAQKTFEEHERAP